MHAYKYPPRWSATQKTQSWQPSSALRTELHKENTRFKMLCSRCVLPFLALYMLPEETSSALLPSRFRNKREPSWLDQELFPHVPDRSDQGDLSVGDAREMDRDVDSRPRHSETFLAPTDHLSLQRQSQSQNRNQNQNQNQNQYQRKANEKRRKVAPLDSIGSFQMSSLRNRKDEPDIYWEEHEE